MTTRTETIRAAAGYLRSWLDAQVAHRRVPGAQVAVRHGGELVLSAALGVADVSTGAPLTPAHLFRVASHSKTFTAALVLQLVEAGRMRLDDPIGVHVPELEAAGSPVARVTVRELLGHQAGVTRDGADADFWQLEQPFPDRAGVIAAALRAGPVLRRNEHFKYSNTGYALVGLAVEAATGTSYAEAVRTGILEPLGLTRTGADHDPARAGEYVTGHTGLLLGEDVREPLGSVGTGALAPATGFFSTAEELAVYGSAHVLGDDRLLGDDAKRLMQRVESVVTAYGTEVGRYGVGLALTTVGERHLVGHSGGWPGQITVTVVDPADGLVVSVLTNAIDGPAEELATGLVKLVDVALHPRTEVPAAPPGSPPPSAFTGRFAGLWGVVDVAELAGRLVLVRPTWPDPLPGVEELQVVDADTLRVAAQPGFGPAGEPVPVERDAGGHVVSLRLGGVTYRPVEEFRRRRSSTTGRPAPSSQLWD
ncbi:CubicO group peptidase, beta-lactamase class C family [Blastococcus sp. DSM 46786]|uniref:serine hydrolase domain-containing protein n=1 Tax=Blastococcus sp. DSM 46786 TaxID=1798227 RepID=UPI0008B794E4|nr:serine hydrolase domain-containing protein [Blastococcus sp. DSM 46786]SEK99898.1 CubicO group peptidase, beta-lactamase class C family [Blastococcus sp. DSM 46786]